MRPGLDAWLEIHWPPALAWGDPRTRRLAREFVQRHGWDEFCSTCCMAAINAWDSWDESRSKFGSWFSLLCRSALRDAVKYRDRRPLPLDDRDKSDQTDLGHSLGVQDEAQWLLRGPHPETMRALMTGGSLRQAAKALGVSAATIHHRVRDVRRWAMAETDVGDDLWGDLIVLPAEPQPSE